jgi:hypothetical protein
MMKVLLLAFLLPFFCTPKEFHAQRVWLFSKTQYSGNVPRMPGGQQAKGYTSSMICFLEIKKGSAAPVWQSAYFNHIKYTIEAYTVNQDSVVIGTLKNTNTPAVVKPAVECQVIGLMLKEEATVEKVETQVFTLKGKMNKTAVFLKSNEPVVELTPALMQ